MSCVQKKEQWTHKNGPSRLKTVAKEEEDKDEEEEELPPEEEEEILKTEQDSQVADCFRLGATRRPQGQVEPRQEIEYEAMGQVGARGDSAEFGGI